MGHTSKISKVALAGKGRFGSVVLDELLQAGFKLTILTRSASSIRHVPAGVEVCEVDYTSEESLCNALRGHDAVVSTVAGTAVAAQKPLIDAAIATGVRHFIPADYAMSLRSPELRMLPPYTDVSEIEKYLRARSDKIDWTVVACGGFLDTSEFGTAAKAVAGVLKTPERVVDHCVQIHATTITQNEIFDIVKQHDSGLDRWTVTHQDGDVQFQRGMDMLNRGELTMEAVSTLMAGALWSGKYKAGFEEIDNEWLGVELISKQRLEEIVKNKVLNGITDIGSDQIVSNY